MKHRGEGWPFFHPRTELYDDIKKDDLISIQAADDIHLQGILDLQKINLPNNLSEEVKRDQGFVTVEHDFDILKSMNDIHRHAIALDENNIVGYALAMDKSFAKEIPFLVSLFNQIESNLLKSNTLDPLNYIVMGQACINREYRSQGIFQKLFFNLKERLSADYDSIFTDVACSNTRSIRAHTKVGFESVEVFETNGEDWDILQWKW